MEYHRDNANPFCELQELIGTLEEQKADLEVAEMSGPPRVEQAADLAEEVATVSQKYDLNVNKLKRQKVRNCRLESSTSTPRKSTIVWLPGLYSKETAK